MNLQKNLQRQCFQMENMTDVSSNSSSERIISRCTFIFEYAAEVKDFVSLIGNTFQTNSGSTLRLDFSKQHLDVLCRNDSRLVLVHCVNYMHKLMISFQLWLWAKSKILQIILRTRLYEWKWETSQGYYFRTPWELLPAISKSFCFLINRCEHKGS